ncbi:MAG: FkbM family methyltransferase [bacterium]
MLRFFQNIWIAACLVRNFPSLVGAYWFAKPGRETVYHLRNGLSVKLRDRTADFRILREVFYHRSYERPPFSVKKGDVVVDIGAHIGLFALQAAHVAGAGRVIAVEPMPDNFRILKENAEVNGASALALVQCAVAPQSGEFNFYVHPDNTAGHSMRAVTAGARKISVRAASLADVMSEWAVSRIDFLKMDCEGTEDELLRSFSDDLFSRISTIALEYHEELGVSPSRLAEFLRSRGYEVRTVPPMIYARRAADGKVSQGFDNGRATTPCTHRPIV